VSTRLHLIAATALLLLAAASAVLWVRSFWVSDWVLVIHRHAPGRLRHAGFATFRGEFAVYYGGPNGSDHGDPRDTLFQYNPQPVGDVMIWPYRNLPEGPARRWFGFGITVNTPQRYCELVARAWFVSVSIAVAGLLVLRRARRLRRAARSGLCPRCGYDVRATPERCPECGTAIISSRRSHRTPSESASAPPPSA
jgi:hypothetical protein